MPTTSQLIALVESNNQPAALRYEPGWKYATPELIEKCRRAHVGLFMSRDTAKVLACMSWGAYQIMGSVLYEMGYAGTFHEFMSSPELQLHWFNIYIRRRGIDYDFGSLMQDVALRERFALRYNGSVTYAARMLEIGRKL